MVIGLISVFSCTCPGMSNLYSACLADDRGKDVLVYRGTILIYDPVQNLFLILERPVAAHLALSHEEGMEHRIGEILSISQKIFFVSPEIINPQMLWLILQSQVRKFLRCASPQIAKLLWLISEK